MAIVPLKPKPCPVCKAPAVDGYRPFCSKRCADVDLGRWFSGAYAVAGSDNDTADDPPDTRPPDGEKAGSD